MNGTMMDRICVKEVTPVHYIEYFCVLPYVAKPMCIVGVQLCMLVLEIEKFYLFNL